MSTARQLVGVARLTLGVFLAIVIVTQIADQSVHSAFLPQYYFTYFTIDTALIEIAVLVAGGLVAMFRPQDGPVLTVAAMSVVPYAIVTGIVYNVMLRGLPSISGYEGQGWIDDALHVWVPLLLALDWFVLTWLVPGRARLNWAALAVTAAFPVVWIVFTYIRGAVTGWYPYPFLDPATNGLGTSIVWVAGLTVFILGLAAVCIALTRMRLGRRFQPKTRLHKPLK